MKLFALCLSLLLSSAALAHDLPADAVLMFRESGQHAHIHWISAPDARKEAMLDMQWMNNGDHSPASPNGNFSVQLWMPDMGHGSSPVAIQSLTDANGQPLLGAYRVSRMFFMMNGDWELRVTLTRADGSKEVASIPVRVGEE